MLLPEPRCEKMDLSRRVVFDALQDIHQVGVRVDALEAARPQEALDDADVLGSDLGPAEEVVAASERNRTDFAFEMIGIDRHARVFEEDPQPLLALEPVAHGLGERTRGEQEVFLGDLPEPGEKRVHDRLAVEGAVLELRLLLETLRADRGLVG